jgi:tetratricopeptide (TPR) repeat protein
MKRHALTLLLLLASPSLRADAGDALNKLQAEAASRPEDAAVQLKAAAGIASLGEPVLAIAYAERALGLAEASRDPGLIREALLTAGEVYDKAGLREQALDRAERVLKLSPGDARAMRIKLGPEEATAAAAEGGASPPAASGSCLAASPKNDCVRDCLASAEVGCAKAGASGLPGCRAKAHMRCNIACRKFVPSLGEALCAAKEWGRK